MNIYVCLYTYIYTYSCMKNFICVQKFMESQSDVIRISVKFIRLSNNIYSLYIFVMYGFCLDLTIKSVINNNHHNDHVNTINNAKYLTTQNDSYNRILVINNT